MNGLKKKNGMDLEWNGNGMDGMNGNGSFNFAFVTKKSPPIGVLNSTHFVLVSIRLIG
jgi:hypothetical protein